MASLVQDVWLGWEPRLRGRRLAPWDEPAVRLVFHLDAGATLDEPKVASFLDSAAGRLEVIAWEPRGQGGSGGRFGPELLEDARRLVADIPGRWGGDLPIVLGGHGLGGWLALAVAEAPGVKGALAFAPSLAAAGRPGPPSLAAAIAEALARPPLDVPTLVIEGRERAPTDAAAVAEWLAREPRASRLVVPGGDAAAFAPPWTLAATAWAAAVGKAAQG
jgi:alpha-beta hydrolase superfamily lysophospholipase